MRHGTVDVQVPGARPAVEPTDGPVPARKALVFLDPEDPEDPGRADSAGSGLPARRLVGALAANGYAVESVPGGSSQDHHHLARFLDAAEQGDLLVVRWPTGQGWTSRDFAALISGFARRAGDCAADALVMIVDFGWVVDSAPGDADAEGPARGVSALPVRGEPSITAAALTTGLAVGERPPLRGFSLTGLIADGLLTGAADTDGDGVVTVADLHRFAVDACADGGLRPILSVYGDAAAVPLARTGRAAAGAVPGELLAAADELRRRGEAAVPSTARGIVARVYDVYLGPAAQDLLRLASLLEDGEPLTSELAALLLADHGHADHGHADHGHADHGHADHGHAADGPGADASRGSGPRGDAGGLGVKALAELGTPWELVDAGGLPAHSAVRDLGRARLTREEHARASATLRRWRAGGRAVRPRARLTPDRWTVDDQLGHGIYAEAVAAFIRHPESLPPLTIGVKGPWGTGKTSLMRMVQDLLDPGAANGSPAEIHLARPASPAERAGRRRRSARLRTGRGAPGSPRVTNAEVLSRARRRGGERAREDPGLSAPVWASLRASDWRPTVWFNPWMYQNGEQVWAGLAHEIITQVTGRLPRVERERFWLELNLARVDREAVRRRAYRMAITRLTPVVLGLAATLVLTCASLAAAVLVPALGPALRAGAAALGACGSMGVLAAGAVRMARFLTESADTAFGGLIRPPDLLGPAPGLAGDLVGDPGYGAKTGFLHLVQTDMRRVLRLVATEERPLVVFVDDLDRCGSGTVAQVIEAINLFLAGEFPNCVFVLAMEPDVVAAHVEVAYQDLAEAMPPDLRSGLGWRFLEKIVQLPLSLPVLDDAHRLPGYVGALLGVDRPRTPRRPRSDGPDASPEAWTATSETPGTDGPAWTGSFETYGTDGPPRDPERGAPGPRRSRTGRGRTAPSRAGWPEYGAGDRGPLGIARPADARFWGWTGPDSGDTTGRPAGTADEPGAGAGGRRERAPRSPGRRSPDPELVGLLEAAIRAAAPAADSLDAAAREAQEALAADPAHETAVSGGPPPESASGAVRRPPDGRAVPDLWPETRLAADRVYDDLYSDENAYRAIEAALPALSPANPRQLKRYVNVFRFYSFVTYRQSLAGAERAGDAAVAKVAALTVRWPHLLSTLAKENGSGETALEVLERAASADGTRVWTDALARCGLVPYAPLPAPYTTGPGPGNTRPGDATARDARSPGATPKDARAGETHEGAPEWDALRELLASLPSVAGLARRLL
ncbi:P-loop NTPase fold protein [Microtetraspora niveoalba]|uniref:P-loop NTPase fold protein n=1 Tax=Microtetraspora niveoalba TaxID=46175 RepID=UPI00082DFBF8|nr:P-loop NTPase fold protein [Microtetraspora niveoalba]